MYRGVMVLTECVRLVFNKCSINKHGYKCTYTVYISLFMPPATTEVGGGGQTGLTLSVSPY